MIGTGPMLDLVVVSTRSAGEPFVRDHGPDKPVLVTAVDGTGNKVVIRRTVATQIPVGATVKVQLCEIRPPRSPDGAALALVGGRD